MHPLHAPSLCPVTRRLIAEHTFLLLCPAFEPVRRGQVPRDAADFLTTGIVLFVVVVVATIMRFGDELAQGYLIAATFLRLFGQYGNESHVSPEAGREAHDAELLMPMRL